MYPADHESGPLNTMTSPGSGIAEAVADLLDDDAVTGTPGAAVQRGFHRLGRDEVHPGDEGLQQEAQYQRHHDENREFAPEGRLLLCVLLSSLRTPIGVVAPVVCTGGSVVAGDGVVAVTVRTRPAGSCGESATTTA